MTAKLNVFAAAPSQMKDWQRAMITLGTASNFEPSLSELVKLRASQINSCANCIFMPPKRAPTERPSSASIYCRRGAKLLAIPIANAQPWHGLRH
jgi:AhpD family alkylhydroperoxidase